MQHFEKQSGGAGKKHELKNQGNGFKYWLLPPVTRIQSWINYLTSLHVNLPTSLKEKSDLLTASLYN